MKLIKQKTSDDCVLCCVAMVTGVSYSKARKAFDTTPPYGFMQECKALVRLGMFPDYRDMTRLYEGRINIVTVPSLNQLYQNHRIVIDTTIHGKWKIYDPNKNKKGKKFYSDSTDIHGFSEVIVIINTNK